MYEYMATVLKVTDGDTLDLRIDLGMTVTIRQKRSRLYGIDTPEMNTEAGKAARTFVLKHLDIGKEVRVRTIKAKTNVELTEKYGSYLVNVYCYPDEPERCLNDDLVAAGHAVPYFGGARG